jgi:hypothetical protein
MPGLNVPPVPVWPDVVCAHAPALNNSAANNAEVFLIMLFSLRDGHGLNHDSFMAMAHAR